MADFILGRESGGPVRARFRFEKKVPPGFPGGKTSNGNWQISCSYVSNGHIWVGVFFNFLKTRSPTWAGEGEGGYSGDRRQGRPGRALDRILGRT